jgi:hypothetical protein
MVDGEILDLGESQVDFASPGRQRSPSRKGSRAATAEDHPQFDAWEVIRPRYDTSSKC